MMTILIITGIPQVMAQETYTNRLSKEKSPYLIQHAHNPVDWYPWGEEAFEKARSENKPIFLSIGYSTCHWCHVMEEESFTNPEIAKVLNADFVSIKVDREERPDLDHIYMQAVMAMTGSGGWPMSVFLTPDLKPFYGGTYFPPTDRWGKPGFATLLNSIAQKWESNREQIFKSSAELTELIQSETTRKAAKKHTIDEKTLETAYRQLESRFDSSKGGFGDAPKFPQSHTLSFILRYWKRSGEAHALEMVEKTLQEMARGGIYDQIGGGFHRYSTDDAWRVPHFEKMLYDQAILSKSYLEAYQATGNAEYARVAREIFDYVLREMTPPPKFGPIPPPIRAPKAHWPFRPRIGGGTKGQSAVGGYLGGGVTGPEGGFYSAEDADSAPDAAKPKEKREGAFYVWSYEEILTHLGKVNAEIFNYYFGAQPNGNAPQDPQGEFRNQNILYMAHGLDETAKKFGKTQDEVERILTESKEKLRAIRAKRPRPHLDDKVLTDWNGLMISSLAFGSRVLNEPRYRDAAQKAADFILERMVSSVIASPEIREHSSPSMGEDKGGGDLTAIPPILTFPHKGGRKHSVSPRNDRHGRLMHRYRDGEVSVTGFLEDYAFFTHGLIDLYEATFDPHYLEEARFLTKEMIRLFWDESHGGFFLTASDAEALISRTKELYDGAIPSGNSVAVLSLLRMGRLTMDREFENQAQATVDAFSAELTQYPSGFCQMMIAIDFALGPSSEIIIAADENDSKIQEIIQEIYSRFLPNKVVAFHSSGRTRDKIEALAPFIKNQLPLGGKTAVYVCKNYICDLPVTEISQLKDLLTQ